MLTELNIPRGADKNFQFTLVDQDNTAIEMDRVNFMVKATIDTLDASASIEKNSHSAGDALQASEIELTDAANGQFTLKLVGADTKDIAPGVYVYGFKIREITTNALIIPASENKPYGNFIIEESIVLAGEWEA